MDALASSVNFSPVTLLSTGTIVLERWYSSRDKGPQGALHKPSKLIEPLERRIAKGEGKPSLPYIILKEHYLLRSIVAYSNVFGGGCGRGCQGLLFPHGLLLDVEKCCVVTPNNQQPTTVYSEYQNPNFASVLYMMSGDSTIRLNVGDKLLREAQSFSFSS